jgi:hypothetical protein
VRIVSLADGAPHPVDADGHVTGEGDAVQSTVLVVVVIDRVVLGGLVVVREPVSGCS